MNKFTKRFSNMQLIIFGYLITILIGSILLSLPIATVSGKSPSTLDAIFTATSATCITGMTLFDISNYWSLFGQITIITLTQIGGIGFITIAIIIMMLTRKKIGLSQRIIMQDSISAPQIGGIVNLTRFILIITFGVEILGAILLSFSFIPKFGIGKGIYFSIFHSISAFCNAGFDLMGTTQSQFTSLNSFNGDWYTNIVFMLLIFIGGLGFFVWFDLINKRFNPKKISLQSKLVLTTSFILIALGTILFFIFEYNNELFKDLTFNNKLLSSLFHSVSMRTAGFSTIDLSKVTNSSKLLIMFLIFIGGSTGSTAGGIKTTTFAVLFLNIFSTFKRKKNIEIFGRRLEEHIIYTASSIAVIYLLITIFSTMIVVSIENISLITALIECLSAITTAGLTFGFTPIASSTTKIILMFLMICGRIGSVSMLWALSSEKKYKDAKFPMDKIQIG